ncbi:hypothetical protein SEA_PINKIEPIE_233 [Streptomyces phage PinkiePie]|nr:hypothetical protein SEA_BARTHOLOMUNE_233 [Streptomyces phage Bartholomune]UOW93625.1 hypothetical protein SEA_SQUILLIUM_236 [Streptomyces phage Squillium]WNM73454.1 hypothetical protein SEA_LIANDRY_233 [Streptomyces phage Liandry]WNM74855.1 hypothetical protein SEA_PINKIEPIE_233 [Streptomyces phage PinkiePie]
MFNEENNIEYDNVDVSAENGMLVLIYKKGSEAVFRTRIDGPNRGKLIWAMWKKHREAKKWRIIPSLTTEGDGSTKETE